MSRHTRKSKSAKKAKPSQPETVSLFATDPTIPPLEKAIRTALDGMTEDPGCGIATIVHELRCCAEMAGQPHDNFPLADVLHRLCDMLEDSHARLVASFPSRFAGWVK